MNVLEVNKIAKNFGDCRAVDGISFSIKTGTVFGLLGPDGTFLSLWRVIKAELAYRKYLIIFFAVFSVLSFNVIWFWVKWERNRVPLILLIMFIFTIMSYLGGRSSLGQPRDRMHVLLPMPQGYVGFIHSLIPLII